MSDWMTASWWAGGILALIALVVMAFALFRDRSRGRRRCPKCWYDMSGVTGMSCPECGRTQRREKRFFRTRRSWRGVIVAMLLLAMSGAIIVVPAGYTGLVARHTPVTILRAVLPHFENSIEAVNAKARGPQGLTRLTQWERLLLAQGIADDMRRAGSRAGGTSLHWLASLGHEARPALPEVALALIDVDKADFSIGVGLLKKLEAARSAVPPIRDAAQSAPEPHRRKQALRALHELGATDRRTLSCIRKVATGDEDPAVRLEAAAFLLLNGREQSAAVDAIEDTLERGAPDERLQALVMINWIAQSDWDSRFEPPQWPSCQRELSKQLHLLGQDPEAERAIRLVGQVLADQDPAVRKMAAQVLTGVGSRVAPLADALRARIDAEQVSHVRGSVIAAYVMAEGQDISFLLPDLLDRLRSGDDAHARWAAWIVGRAGTRAGEAVPILRERALRCSAPWHGVYCEALAGLGPSGWGVLDEFMRGPEPLAWVATTHLARAGARHEIAANHVLAAADDPVEGVRANVAEYITGCIKQPGAMEIVHRLARTDPAPRVRRSALYSLNAHAGERTALATLERALRDPDDDVRELAERLLLQRASSSVEARTLVERLARDADASVRERAARITRLME